MDNVRPSWDTIYMSMCYLMAYRSPDDSTKVGSVITTEDNVLLVTGYNGICRGLQHSEHMFKRPEKYMYFEHAERNAIYNAARTGVRLDLAYNLYVPWLPCADCARAIIQTGIKRVITHADGELAHLKYSSGNWEKSHEVSLEMFSDSNVELHTYNGPIVGNLQGFFGGNVVELKGVNYSD